MDPSDHWIGGNDRVPENCLLWARRGSSRLKEAHDVKDKAMIIGSDGMGRGDEALGRAVMGNFLRHLAESPDKPRALFLLNSAVKMAAEGSPVLQSLKRLEEAGVEILCCRTCVEWFGLEQKLEAGRISTVGAVIGLMAGNDTITI